MGNYEANEPSNYRPFLPFFVLDALEVRLRIKCRKNRNLSGSSASLRGRRENVTLSQVEVGQARPVRWGLSP